MTWAARPTIEPGEYPRGDEIEAFLDQISFLTDPPRAQLRQTSAQTVTTGTFTAMNFEAEDADNYGGHSTSTNITRYTCQVAGVYRLTGKIAWAASATGRRASDWRKNGSSINGSQVAYAATSASGVQHLAMTTDVTLAVGDYVELFGFHEVGSNLATDVTNAGVQTYMNVLWIAAA